MPKYFFNVHDGLDIADDDGIECADLDTALREAVRYAGALLKDTGHHLNLGDTWSLEVVEETASTAFRIDLQIRPGLARAVSAPRRSAA